MSATWAWGREMDPTVRRAKLVLEAILDLPEVDPIRGTTENMVLLARGRMQYDRESRLHVCRVSMTCGLRALNTGNATAHTPTCLAS